MILFFDENMPPRVADALRALGTVEAWHLTQHLPRGTPDEEVFAFLAGKDWLLVTQDERIRKRPHQRQALLAAGVGAFILTGRADRNVEQTLQFLLSRLDEMRRLAGAARPFIFGVPDKGKIDRLG